MVETWELTEMLEGKDADAIISGIRSDVDKFKGYKEKLDGAGEDIVLEILGLKEKISASMMRLEAYYSLRFYGNTKDDEAASRMSYLKQLGTEMGNETMFFQLWLMKIGEEKAQNLIRSKKLERFRHYIELMRALKDHTLSEDIERIINLKNVASSGFFDIYEHITSSFEYEFEGKTITEEELRTKARDADPKIRESAYRILLGKYKDNKSPLSEIYRNIVLDWYNEDVKIRKYNTPISSRNLSNDLDDETITALLNVVRRNNGVFQEYFRLKHGMINAKSDEKDRYEFSRYHLYAPYKVQLRKYDYEYSKKYVLETLKMFDERFFEAAKKIFDAKHVHSHPQKNKRGGAFCMNITNKNLPYILLNHTDDLRDMFTLAHEFGHGIHDVLSMVQPNLLQHAPIPLAETASIFSEMILADRILKSSKDMEEKKYIIMSLLDNQYASINRQAYFVVFEIYAHDNIIKGIQIDKLDGEYMKLLEEQFGDMKIPDLFRNEWNVIPHIHETPFYCYAYAFGNLLVLSLYDMYRKEMEEKKDGKGFIDKYVQILSAGGSKSPKELLAGVGIDISSEGFWQRGFDMIKEELEELKSLE